MFVAVVVDVAAVIVDVVAVGYHSLHIVVCYSVVFVSVIAVCVFVLFIIVAVVIVIVVIVIVVIVVVFIVVVAVVVAIVAIVIIVLVIGVVVVNVVNCCYLKSNTTIPHQSSHQETTMETICLLDVLVNSTGESKKFLMLNMVIIRGTI